MTMIVGERAGRRPGWGSLQSGVSRRRAGWLLVAYLVPLAVLVLSIRLTDIGLPQVADTLVLWATDLGVVPGLRFGHVEAAANVLVFIPIGLLLSGVCGRSGTGRRGAGLPDGAVWLIATLMSASIELTQMFLLTERSATVRDLICNSTGALAGVLIYRIVHVARLRATRRDRP